MHEVTNKTIIFIEDDAVLLDRMTAYFGEKNNTVHAASTLADARSLLTEIRRADAVGLDMILPVGAGSAARVQQSSASHYPLRSHHRGIPTHGI